MILTEHHVRIGDLAAGTLLVHDEVGGEKAFAGLHAAAAAGGLSPQSADLIQELLDRWSALDDSTRASIARNLIARVDPSAASATLALQDSRELRAHLTRLLAGGAGA